MGHANTPPHLPEVTDEAGDSPVWLPALGAALFVLCVAWVVWSHGANATSSAEGGADVAAEAE